MTRKPVNWLSFFILQYKHQLTLNAMQICMLIHLYAN